ncbi:MAG: DUF5928 domain-containing protein [Pseudomonadota bacterium]
MAKIAYILLCHKDPTSVIEQATRLTEVGDYISIHFDRSAKAAAYREIREGLSGNPNVAFAKRRVNCGWGEWSLVRATLNALEAAVAAFPDATHFYIVSGDCMMIKTAEYAHAFLDAADMDYIECHDFFKSNWIKTGMKEERLIYRHFFNERTQKNLFYWSWWGQRRLGLERQVPEDLEIMIGSQWWCLRRTTVEAVLEFSRTRRDVMRFFATTWIPDETFFQTLVRHLVPREEIECRTLTFLMFSDYGMPVTFYNDQYELLLGQDHLFARKISPDAKELKAKLGALYAQTGMSFEISAEGERLFKFLTGRGREGRRFAPRFWEAEASLGRQRELLIIVCKKWHVAKRLVARIKQETNLPVIEYLFEEEDTRLPDLGGVQSTIEKRTRHRRALVKMLFDYYETERLLICLDPSSFDLLMDFENDRSTLKVLGIDCEFTDDYLVGHAVRVGLARENTPKETIEKVLPTIRGDVIFEHERLRDADLSFYRRIHQSAGPEDNAVPIGEFLSVNGELAQKIAETEYLFVD